MDKVKAYFINRVKRTSTVESFRFATEGKINFFPGQFLQMIFDKDDLQNKNLNKYLSFSSSPAEDYIEVTKRISGSEFSKRLLSLRKGEEVIIRAPMGKVYFNEAYRKIGFLVGGIGITPVMSILSYIVEKKLDTDAFLLYSSRTEDEIAFKDEIEVWSRDNKNIRVYFCITETKPEKDKYIRGVINKDIIYDNVSDIHDRIIFIYGPPKMVESMKNICLQTGCEIEKIQTENFAGY